VNCGRKYQIATRGAHTAHPLPAGRERGDRLGSRPASYSVECGGIRLTAARQRAFGAVSLRCRLFPIFACTGRG
jgi:hypothetical protein